MNQLIFNGANFLEFSAVILESDFLKGAERDVTTFSVLGRSGDLIADNNRFKNLSYSVLLAVRDNMALNMADMRSFLASSVGYCRLEETDSPDEFRMAEFHQAFAPNLYDHLSGTVKLTFGMKPQRWLKAGETWTNISAASVLRNPTRQTAKPLIRVTGSGSFQVGGVTITIAEHSLNYIDLDCDIMAAYCGSTNASQYVSMSGNDWPELAPGANGVTVDGVTLQVQPRWFEI